MAPLYIGRTVDPGTFAPTADDVLYDPDRLTRHAVCFGMTGSGKTGLCVTLLEELAIAGVPVLVLDPKGDMANLALAFAGLEPEDFAPWVDAAEAEREGLSVEAFAARTAARWREGLAAWGVGPDRVRAFAEGVDVSILTPGSRAGTPVDVLSALALPDPEVRADPEAFRDLVSGTVGALLGLVGIEADPVGDPEHILLATILGAAWEAGEDLDLSGLIVRLVDPPFDKVGVFPVDTFFPRSRRMKLAMKLNGVVASPAFSAWSEGVPLDPDALLAPVGGRTPIRVFYTAHLDDAQRMFFLSTLLNRVVAWSRRQPGASSLRALVYFDEVFGFLPPHPRNPPTKRPLLTLLKQARAVGVGTMLVTQNPVDVDYKALSNAGTWFVGRLQTPQDRERVLDGLAAASGRFDRAAVSRWLEDLPSRTFVVRDAKEDAPTLLHSRWAISYLRGPLTRREIARLPGHRPPPSAPPAPASPSIPDDPTTAEPPPCPKGVPVRWLDPRVVFSARFRDVFQPAARPRRPDGETVWAPAIAASLHLRFDEGRDYVSERSEHRLFFPLDGAGPPAPIEIALEPGDLLPGRPEGGRYLPLPGWLDEEAEFEAFERRIVEEVLRGETDTVFRHRGLRLVSRAGETREAFEARVAAAIQDRIDAEVAKLKAKVDRKVARLEERRRRLEEREARYRADSRARAATEVVSAAETIFGLFFGGRRRSLTGIATRRQQTMRAQERLHQARQDLAALEREIYDLEIETAEAIDAIEAAEARRADDVEAIAVRLERNDLRVDAFHLLWVPVTRPV